VTISQTRLRKLRDLQRRQDKTCPTCHGHGELTRCVNDGHAGCSHQLDPSWPCPDCHGEGTRP
jgi:DnaJ-class molecular chaperone